MPTKPPVKFPDIDLLKHMAVRPELFGTELQLIPMPETISSQRETMASGNASQVMVCGNGEHPQMFTGYETVFGNYRFNSAELREPSIIREVIPKFIRGGHANPTVTVVCIGSETGEVYTFDTSSYVHTSQQFGYPTKRINWQLLHPGTMVPAGTEFDEPINHDGPLYGMGVNVNTAFLTMPENVEDACYISKSLQKKLTFFRVTKHTINLRQGEQPLNLYGDEYQHKSFPDLGEYVNDDGVVMALRPVHKGAFSSMTDAQLTIIHPLMDTCYRVPANSKTKVVDITLWPGRALSREQLDDSQFQQVREYLMQQVTYYDRIVALYVALTEENHTCGDKFNDLVTRALAYLAVVWRRYRQFDISQPTMRLLNNSLRGGQGSRDFGMYDCRTRELVELLRVEIVLMSEVHADIGWKLTGRDGCKSIISAVRDDEEMPVDDYGIRADLVVCSRGSVNRIIGQQLYEQFFNRTAWFVARQAEKLGSKREQLDYILGFLTMIDDQFAELVRRTLSTPQLIGDYLETCFKDRIHYRIAPTSSFNKLELVRALRERYGVTKTPVTFTITHRDGRKEAVRTESCVAIGAKYIWTLYKIPDDQLSAIAGAYVNQHHAPIKPTSEQKRTQAIGKTPVRFGEDEKYLIRSSTDAAVRFFGIVGGSDAAFGDLAMRLLTDKQPSKLDHIQMDTGTIVRTSSTICTLNHTLAVVGIALEPPTVPPDGD